MFAVGGFVRDYFLNVQSKDLDIVCPEFSTYQEMKDFAEKSLGHVKVENPEYGRIRVLAKSSNLGHFQKMWLSLNGHLPQYVPVDLMLPRVDLDQDGRGCKIELSSLEEDLNRRDLTINAMAMSRSGELLDPHNGLNDLEKRRIVFVGDMEQRIKEDYLRILRAIRFSLTKNCSLPEDFWGFLSLNEASISDKLAQLVSVDRKREELTKMFDHDTLKALRLLDLLPDLIRQDLFQNIRLKPVQF